MVLPLRLHSSPGLEVFFSYICMIMKYAGGVRFFFYPKENQNCMTNILPSTAFQYLLLCQPHVIVIFPLFSVHKIQAEGRCHVPCLTWQRSLAINKCSFPWMKEFGVSPFLKCQVLDAEEKETIFFFFFTLTLVRYMHLIRLVWLLENFKPYKFFYMQLVYVYLYPC